MMDTQTPVHPTRPFEIVVAASVNGGIGLAGQLPWQLPQEMARFKALTLKTANDDHSNAVIMGRRTYESIPAKFRPLKGRVNIVLSRDQHRNCVSLPDSVVVASSFDEALLAIQSMEKVERVFVIGGAQVYAEAIKHNGCQAIYLTQITSPEFEVDTFFPQIDPHSFKLDASYPEQGKAHEEKGVTYEFLRYVRSKSVGPHEEEQYLRLVHAIIKHGNDRDDRTGVGTLSRFGCQMRFSLRDGTFPLLTTKRVWWKGVAEELLWFVSGCTNANTLATKKVNIWKENGSKDFLAKCGLGHREEGDLGPVYGFQWRHWGAKYVDMHTDYSGQGHDQLAECIALIKHNPTSRRIVMSAWNPTDLKEMVLPPCHMFCQFYVANGELSCQMYQRSADMGLGVPFNIASYSLLTCLVAHVCGLIPGEFVHTIGDAHVYKSHIEGLKEQLTRPPYPFPKLHIKDRGQNIDGFVYEDLVIEGYQHHPTITLPFAV
jgi:dihydrofolate reductase/thymidylate synthase